MRLRFLGTGVSSGVPAIGCSCAVCTSTDPRDNRLRTSAALEFTDPAGVERVILIDASPDLRQQALRASLQRVDAILITHNHVDHIFGLDEVRRFNLVMGAPIDVHADAHTHESLRRVYRHIFEPERSVQRSFVASLNPREAKPLEPFDLFGLTVTPVPLLHGKLPILGYRFDHPDAPGALPLAYCTDVSDIPHETRPHLGGLSTLVLGALRHKPHPTHFNIEQATAEAQRIGAERTYFVHMAHDVSHAQTSAALPEGVALAHDGLVLGP
ncbi:MAG: MBL fold metallo-hydrolase [Phycisphaeraceae bacterium]|nr:MAG: MBL fold metallo-hydrolase [Phycisphaeraceae bacterium]